MRIARFTPSIAAAALSACMPPHPAPAPAPAEVIPQSTNVALSRLPAAALAAYAGTYRSGADTLIIRRAGDALFADRNGVPAGAPLTLVGLGTFVDGVGTSYLFVPADGSAGKLRTVAANGTSRDWAR
ncbi:hypothetical protein H9L12_11250 [Sphingomonas rhizophila]|uniref:Uncharacterized protein n=1 Tax=Sphingomonas rhizophila TaxID=2071607 RepID=A0A7G9SAD2_9SPHN|nr:hypothetical protein [Sphingomonas rhizophila]QNN64807.1 hypothetical protein H9L12_11250 [Sphingomonas rhizophila]